MAPRAYLRALLGGAAAVALLVPGLAAAEESQGGSSGGVPLPEIRVVPTTPVTPPVRRAPATRSAGVVRAPARTVAPTRTVAPARTVAAVAEPAAVPGAVQVDKIPYNVQTVPASAFEYSKSPDLLQSLAQSLPGVSLGDQTGNQFQLDINYRGFTAGPVIGTPQGLAVYQYGVRINEVFGDVVNWDLIPQNAINSLTLVPSNPVYGLNAIGGALSLQMKNGFTYHGVEGEVSGGSYGRITTSMQAGGQTGNLSGYITADATDDAGWRQNSPSTLRRVFADLGARGDQTEFHLSFTGADNTYAVCTVVSCVDVVFSLRIVELRSFRLKRQVGCPSGRRSAGLPLTSG